VSRYHLFNGVYFEEEVSVLRWAQVFSASSVIPSYVENLHISCGSPLDDSSIEFSTFTGLKGLFIGGDKVNSVRPRHLNRTCFDGIALFHQTLCRRSAYLTQQFPPPTCLLHFAIYHAWTTFTYGATPHSLQAALRTSKPRHPLPSVGRLRLYRTSVTGLWSRTYWGFQLEYTSPV
jgi:hypothetical protein